jgi:hypothetical protein
MAPLRKATLFVLGVALPAALALGAPAGAQDVDTPAETTPPVAAPAPPPPAPEPAPPQREVLVPANEANAPRKSRFRIGPELSLFLPSSGKTSDAFGSSWFGVGLGFGSIRRTARQGELGAEVYLLNNSHDDADAWLVPVGLAYRHPIGSGLGGGPYAGGAVDLLFTDLHSPADGVDWGLRMGAGLGPIVGSTFGNSGYVEARYLLTTKVAGFDLSGLSFTAGARF